MPHARAAAAALLLALACGGGGSERSLPPGTFTVVLGEPAGPATAPEPVPSPPCALPVRPAETGAAVLELGTHPVGAELSFELPPGVGSLSIVAQEVEGSAVDAIGLEGTLANGVLPNPVLAPGVEGPYFDFVAALNAVPDASGQLAFGFPLVSSVGAFTIPNTSRGLELARSAGGTLPAGTWSFTLSDLARECLSITGCSGGSAEGRYDVKILTKAGPIPARTSLDLDLYLVTDRFQAGAITGVGSQANVVRRFLAGIAFLLERGGVVLRTVTVRDVPAWARTEFLAPDTDEIGACGDLARLFGLASGRAGIHLFLVEDLVTGDTGGGSLVGIDGSIPGPSGVPGTGASGAAVVAANLGVGSCGGAMNIDRCGTDFTAYVAAHEIGHWLGLFHVTELTGTSFDPLSDTPTCVCSACSPASERPFCAANAGIVFPRRCSRPTGTCAGGGNLMFWALDPAVSAGALTAEQGAVMRANPATE